MSYILEALADSEQARRELAVLPRYSLLPAVGEDRSRLRHWPYVLAAALLVNAAVLPLWLRSNSHDSVAAVSEPLQPQAASKPIAAPVAKLAPPAAVDAQMPQAAPAPAKAVVAASERAPVALRGLPQVRQPQPYVAYDRPVARASKPADAPPKKAAVSAANAAVPAALPKALSKSVPVPTAAGRAAAASVAPAPSAPAAPQVQAVAPTRAAPAAAVATSASGALPPDLQREIPPLSVAGFIRDDSSSGMVIVNDRLLREGDEVAPGLRLEKILHDGLVFNYKGYSFRR